jgi:uncharacterized protein (DUF2141 family)
MKYIFFFISSIISIKNLKAQSLNVTINGLKKQGVVMVGLYNKSDNFGNPKNTFKIIKSNAASSDIQVKFSEIPNGEYAIAIFQDLNQNGKLEKNFIGKPTEPYAFSNNVKPVFSAPTFEDCKFRFSGSETIKINIIEP